MAHFPSGGSAVLSEYLYVSPSVKYECCLWGLFKILLKKLHGLFWSYETGSMDAWEDKPVNELSLNSTAAGSLSWVELDLHIIYVFSVQNIFGL